MNEQEIRDIVFAKDTKEAYAKFKGLESLCIQSNILYPYLDLYLEALHSPNSCVRGRGFKMIARNSVWDTEQKTDCHMADILSVLDDEKPTVVRQCLPLVSLLVKSKKELIPTLRQKLLRLNYLQYKESMQGLIQKDIDHALEALAERTD